MSFQEVVIKFRPRDPRRKCTNQMTEQARIKRLFKLAGDLHAWAQTVPRAGRNQRKLLILHNKAKAKRLAVKPNKTKAKRLYVVWSSLPHATLLDLPYIVLCCLPSLDHVMLFDLAFHDVMLLELRYIMLCRVANECTQHRAEHGFGPFF